MFKTVFSTKYCKLQNRGRDRGEGEREKREGEKLREGGRERKRKLHFSNLPLVTLLLLLHGLQKSSGFLKGK
jgi:hypothetical protein